MFWNDLKNTILNKIAIWCIEHCYIWATTFYTACNRLDIFELKSLTQSAIEYREAQTH